MIRLRSTDDDGRACELFPIARGAWFGHDNVRLSASERRRLRLTTIAAMLGPEGLAPLVTLGVLVGVGVVLWRFELRVIGLWVHSPIILGSLALVLGLTQLWISGFRWYARRTTGALLALRRCPSCAYDLGHGPEPDEDEPAHKRRVCCPECGLAWEAGRLGLRPGHYPGAVRIPCREASVAGARVNLRRRVQPPSPPKTIRPLQKTASTGEPPNSNPS